MSDWYVKTQHGEFGTLYELRDDLNGIVVESPYETAKDKFERIAAAMNACSGLNPEGIPGLVGAAEYYAAKENWIDESDDWHPDLEWTGRDMGDKARQALSAVKEKP